MTLLQGRCRAFGDVAPYGPFIEIVADVPARRCAPVRPTPPAWSRTSARIDASLESFVPLYLHLLVGAGERYPLPRHLQGEHLQAALVDALAAFFTAVSQRTTVVVLFEDWHWADSASRAALARIREIVPIERLLFIVTTRPDAAVPDASAAGRHRDLRSNRWTLPPPSAIIEAGLGAGHVSDALVARVFERTGGNPFFLEQVCRALRRAGRGVSVRGGEAVVEGGPDTLSLPDTVQAVIRARLDNLEPHAREVVRVAAVFGREFEHALLADVVGPEIDLAPAIARLIDSGLICAVRRAPLRLGYRFTHVLTQEVSYESLLVHQRKSLHEAVGARLRAASPRSPGRGGGAARAPLLTRGSVARGRPLRARAPPTGPAASANSPMRSARSNRSSNGCPICQTMRNRGCCART